MRPRYQPVTNYHGGGYWSNDNWTVKVQENSIKATSKYGRTFTGFIKDKKVQWVSPFLDIPMYIRKLAEVMAREHE